MADPLNRSEIWELFAFALDLYRAPLKFLPYVARERPVPAGFDALLEALNKREGAELWLELSERLDASPEQLRNAGFFLVKRLLFAEGADHYRVLGLDSDADIGQARERYRLLMALFHPDRNHGGDEWNEQYAPRINEAYNTLKNPRRRLAYDRRVRGGALWGDNVPAPGSGTRGSDVGQRRETRADPGARPQSGSPGEGSGSRAARRAGSRPRFHVWFGLLLVGVVVWFGVQVYESGALKLVSKEGTKRAVEAETVSETPPDVAGEENTNTGFRIADSVPEPEPPVVDPALAGPQTAAAPPPTRIEPECPPEGCGYPEAAAPVPNDVPASTGRPKVADETVVATATESPAVPTPAPGLQVKPPVSTAPEPPKGAGPIGQGDIDFLISRFIQAYEAGNAGKLAGLFGSHVRSDEGIGRDRVAKRYRELFRTTRRRSMQVKDLHWKSEGEGVASISFLVVVKHQDRATSVPRNYLAGVELLAYRDLKGLKISKFIQRVVTP